MAMSENELEVENVDDSGTDTTDVSTDVSAASSFEAAETDQADAASVVVSEDSVSCGDAGGSSVVIVESIDTSAIEQYLASIDERLETVEAFTESASAYVAYETSPLFGSDISDYNVRDGLLLLCLVGIVVAAVLNRWRW